MYSRWEGIGRVGKDKPEVKTAQSGTKWTSFSFVTERYAGKDAEGKAKIDSVWHNCTAFGQVAERIGQYVQNGALLFIVGEYVYEEGKGENEGKRYYKVIVSDFKMLEKRADRPAQAAAPASTTSAAPAAVDEDIPF